MCISKRRNLAGTLPEEFITNKFEREMTQNCNLQWSYRSRQSTGHALFANLQGVQPVFPRAKMKLCRIVLHKILRKL